MANESAYYVGYGAFVKKFKRTRIVHETCECPCGAAAHAIVNTAEKTHYEAPKWVDKLLEAQNELLEATDRGPADDLPTHLTDRPLWAVEEAGGKRFFVGALLYGASGSCMAGSERIPSMLDSDKTMIAKSLHGNGVKLDDIGLYIVDNSGW